MKKNILLILLLLLAIPLITGCGHNMALQSKGIGIDVSWNGSNYVPNLKLGYWDDTTAAVRGNATVSASTASGGGLMVGEGGTSQTLQIATGTQVNEGYIKDILVDPNIATEAKIEFIKALTKLEQPSNDGAHNKTTSAESNILTTAPTEEQLKEQQAKEAEAAIDELVKKLETMQKEKAKESKEAEAAINELVTKLEAAEKPKTKTENVPKAVPAAEQKK